MYIIRTLSIYSIVLPCAFAQETINFATVSGRVADPSGAIVQAAKVTARHIDTNTSSATQTDA